MAEADPNLSPNRETRSSVIIRALVEAEGLHAERRVRNLSRSGACVDNSGDIRAGTTVHVTMGSIQRLAAEVMWAKPNLAGLRFHRPVNLEEARKSRSTATTATPRTGWAAELDNPYRRGG